MKVKDIKDLSIDELNAKGVELKQEIFNIRFQLNTGRLENTAKLASLRKDIARVKTILRDKRG